MTGAVKLTDDHARVLEAVISAGPHAGWDAIRKRSGIHRIQGILDELTDAGYIAASHWHDNRSCECATDAGRSALLQLREQANG